MNPPTPRLVYRLEFERGGVRHVCAIVAADLVDAAQRAQAVASRPGDRVVALQAVAELL